MVDTNPRTERFVAARCPVRVRHVARGTDTPNHDRLADNVQQSGPIAATRMGSVPQLMASTRRPTEFAAMTGVGVLWWVDTWWPRTRQINAIPVLGKLNLDEEMIVPTNAVVSVPPVQSAKAGRNVGRLSWRTFPLQDGAIGTPK
jgi:hypothetical protein